MSEEKPAATSSVGTQSEPRGPREYWSESLFLAGLSATAYVVAVFYHGRYLARLGVPREMMCFSPYELVSSGQIALILIALPVCGFALATPNSRRVVHALGTTLIALGVSVGGLLAAPTVSGWAVLAMVPILATHFCLFLFWSHPKGTPVLTWALEVPRRRRLPLWFFALEVALLMVPTYLYLEVLIDAQVRKGVASLVVSRDGREYAVIKTCPDRASVDTQNRPMMDT